MMVSVDAAGWAAVTGVVAFVAAFLLLAVTHWATLLMAGRQLSRLACYVIGCTEIGVVFVGWSLVQMGPMPGVWVSFAYVVTVAGAGLGTLFGYVLDRWQGGDFLEAVRRGKQRAAGDCGGGDGYGAAGGCADGS